MLYIYTPPPPPPNIIIIILYNNIILYIFIIYKIYYFIHVQHKCYYFREYISLYQSKHIVFKEVVLHHLPLQTETEGRNQRKTERENDLLLRKQLMFVCGWLSSAQFTSAVHWARTTHTHTHTCTQGQQHYGLIDCHAITESK